MDWISVSAACSAASDAITRASLAINKFVRDVRECRAEFDTISAELHSLDGVLDLLGYDAPFFPLALAERTPGVLDTCLALLNELEGCVSLLGSPSVSRAEKKSRWLASRGHIDVLRWTLSEYKVVLGLAADLVGVTKPQPKEKPDQDASGGEANAPRDSEDNGNELATVTGRIIQVASDSEKDWQQSVALEKLGQYVHVLQAAAVAAGSGSESKVGRRRRNGYGPPGGPPDSAIDMRYDRAEEQRWPKRTTSVQPRNKPPADRESDEFDGELNEMPMQSPPPVPRRCPSRLSSATGSQSSTRGMRTPELCWSASPAATVSSPRTSEFSVSSSFFSQNHVQESGYCTPVTMLSETHSHTRMHSRQSSLAGHVLDSVFENPRPAVPTPTTRPSTSGYDPRQVESRQSNGSRRSNSKLSNTFRSFGLKRRTSSNPDVPEGTKTTGAHANLPTAIFGVPLAESIQLAQGVASTHHATGSSSARAAREYPLSVLRCVYHIRDCGVDFAHVFGADGDPRRVAQLRDLFSSPAHSYGRDLDWAAAAATDPPGFTPHDAADLVLLYLAELPKPLISESVGKRWIALSRQATVSGAGFGARLDQGLDFWEEAMVGIRGPARALFKLLLNLWGDIADAAEANDMTAERLAGRVIRPLMHEAVARRYTEYLLGLAFLIRKRSEYNMAARQAAKKSRAAF